jgi:hypothetical protein
VAVAWEQRLSGVITSRPVVPLGCMRACWRAIGQGKKIGATGNCDRVVWAVSTQEDRQQED